MTKQTTTEPTYHSVAAQHVCADLDSFGCHLAEPEAETTCTVDAALNPNGFGGIRMPLAYADERMLDEVCRAYAESVLPVKARVMAFVEALKGVYRLTGWVGHHNEISPLSQAQCTPEGAEWISLALWGLHREANGLTCTAEVAA